MDLRYLYVGSSDTGRDVEAWLGLPGALRVDRPAAMDEAYSTAGNVHAVRASAR